MYIVNNFSFLNTLLTEKNEVRKNGSFTYTTKYTSRKARLPEGLMTIVMGIIIERTSKIPIYSKNC